MQRVFGADAIVFLVVHQPYGLNFLAWFTILLAGGVGWVSGFAFSYVARWGWRFANRSGRDIANYP